MVFRRFCQCHYDVWSSVGLVGVTMTYGVPSVLSVSPWRKAFRRFCQCHHDVWCSVGRFVYTSLRGAQRRGNLFISGQNKSPTKMRSQHKNTKHWWYLRRTEGDINILAFFQVVASGQISPHFRGAKVVKFFDLQIFSLEKFYRFLHSLRSVEMTRFVSVAIDEVAWATAKEMTRFGSVAIDEVAWATAKEMTI